LLILAAFSSFLNYIISYIIADVLGSYIFRTGLMQLCVMRDGRGNLQSFLGFDPTGPWRVGRGVTGFRATNLQFVVSFSRTGPRNAVQPRSNGTGSLRRCSSISSNQIRLYCFAQHAVTRRRCDYWMMPQFRICSA